VRKITICDINNRVNYSIHHRMERLSLVKHLFMG